MCSHHAQLDDVRVAGTIYVPLVSKSLSPAHFSLASNQLFICLPWQSYSRYSINIYAMDECLELSVFSPY